MGIWGALRQGWDETSHLFPSRVHITGDTRVVERRGIEEHNPVRPPEKWKRITILGGVVYINGHDSVKALRECPSCAALIVDDAWAKEVHMKACQARGEVKESSEEDAG
jgi:hypothetical protein